MTDLIEQIDKLYATIEGSEPKHANVEDDYYSCPQSSGGCTKSDTDPNECTCGADALIGLMREWRWALRQIRNEADQLAASEAAYRTALVAARDALASSVIVAERVNTLPSFKELQGWALAHGWSGATDSQAFEAWKANREGPGFAIMEHAP